MYPTPCSLAKLNLSRALSTLVLRGFHDGGDVGMVAEIFTESAPKDAHSSTVDNADTRKPGEEGTVEEAFDFGLGFVGGAPDDIDLGGHVVGVVVGCGYGDASAFASSFEWSDYLNNLDLG